MRTEEEGVGRALRALVPEPPQPIQFDDIARRRRRRTTTQLLVPLVAAAVAAAVVVPVVLTSGSGRNKPPVASPPTGAGVVPWVNRPASMPPPPSEPAPPPALYPACTAAQVSVRSLGGGAAAGNLASKLRMTNTSASPCTLRGYPTKFIGVRRDGTQRVLRPGHGTMFDASGYWPANLRPGDSATLTIATGDACPALNQPTPQTDPYSGELVGLPGGGEVSGSAAFDPSCGLGVSQLGVPAPSPPDPNAYAGLALSIDRPQTAAAGTLMHFTVTLHNTAESPVQLDPCPVYTESIYSGGANNYVYTLNCDKITAIQPGQSVTYAMQIPVPSQPGTAKFGWSIPAGSLFAGGILTIASPARSCSSGFALSLVSDRNGQPTPLDAARWFGLHGGISGVPRSGWRQVSSAGREAELASGASTLHAIQGPDKTWQIDSGEPCG